VEGLRKTTTKCIRITSIVAYKGEVTSGAKMFGKMFVKKCNENKNLGPSPKVICRRNKPCGYAIHFPVILNEAGH
jgi:hypothetical protein